MGIRYVQCVFDTIGSDPVVDRCTVRYSKHLEVYGNTVRTVDRILLKRARAFIMVETANEEKEKF